VKVGVIADVCFDFLCDLNLHTLQHDVVLSLTNSVLAEHINDNQVTTLARSLAMPRFHAQLLRATRSSN